MPDQSSTKQAMKETHEQQEDREAEKDLAESQVMRHRTVQGQIVFPEKIEKSSMTGYVKLHKLKGGSTKLGVITNGSFKLEGVEPGAYVAESVVRGMQSRRTPVYVGESQVPTLAITMDQEKVGAGHGAIEDLGENSQLVEKAVAA